MKFICLLFLIVSMVTCFNGQNKTIGKSLKGRSKPVKERIKIDPAKPSVYIDFVKVGDNEPFNMGEPRERVYLKLVNNSKWSIYIREFDYIDQSKGVGLYYDVERENESKYFEGEVPRGYKEVGDILKGSSRLKSGKSVNFSVPNNHLADNLLIRVYFYYDWVWSSFEKEDTTNSPYPEIESSVYFTHSMLESFLKVKK